MLIVDPDQAIAQACHQALARACHVCRIAPDIEVGKTLLKINKYEAVVVDWLLPDALSLGERARNEGVSRVVFTGPELTEETRSALRILKFGYLVKPFGIGALFAAIGHEGHPGEPPEGTR